MSSRSEALDTYRRLRHDKSGVLRVETFQGEVFDFKCEDFNAYSRHNSFKNIFILMEDDFEGSYVETLENLQAPSLFIKMTSTVNDECYSWIEKNKDKIKLLHVTDVVGNNINWILKEGFNFYLHLLLLVSLDDKGTSRLVRLLLRIFEEGVKMAYLELGIFNTFPTLQEDLSALEQYVFANHFEGSLNYVNPFSGTTIQSSLVNTLNVWVRTTGRKGGLAISFNTRKANINLSLTDITKSACSLENLVFKNLSIVVIHLERKRHIQPIMDMILPFIEVHSVVSECELMVGEESQKLDAIDNSRVKQLLALLKSRELKKLDRLLKNNKKGLYNRAKMMVVGAGAAGKTSLVRSLVGEKFIKKHVSTIVGDKLTANMANNDVDLTKWNMLGNGDHLISQDFLAMGKTIAINESRGTRHIANSYGISTNSSEPQKTYQHNERISELIREKSQRNKEKKKQKRHFGKEKGNAFSEKEDKGRKLSIYDFGGQKVFDVLHHLYLTNAGLVLLVVNLLLFLTEPEESILKFRNWLQSLSVYTKNVRVFIVGTRVENKKVKRNFAKITEMMHNVLLDFDILDIAWNGDLRFFPVENSLGKKNAKYLQPLKTSISQAFDPKTSTLKLPANEKIPLAWIFFLRLIHRDFGNITSLRELYEKGESMGFDLTEMKEFVEFFTKAGIIVSFHKRFRSIRKGSSVIVDDVVLRPEWLLKALATFVCDEGLHENEFKRVSAEQHMGRLVTAYTKTGILANSMLDKVLELSGASERETAFIKNVGVKMLVMSRLSSVPPSLKLAPRHYEAANGFWLVPSMNKENEGHQLTTEAVVTTGTIAWDDIVPQGLFERCVCSLLDQDPVETRLLNLSTRSANIEYKGVIISLEGLSPNEYKVSVATKNQSILREVKSFVLNMNTEVNSLGFALKINARIDFANHIAFNTVTAAPNVRTNSSEIVWDCFLSHTWGKGQATHKNVVKIARMLQGKGVNVWLDEEQMTNNIVYEMVEGINKSACFVAFITEDYLIASDNPDSNAGKELHYAIKHGTSNMVPVLLDSNYADPKKWKFSAGLLFGSALYIDFTSQNTIESNLDSLCSRIKQIVQNRKGK